MASDAGPLWDRVSSYKLRSDIIDGMTVGGGGVLMLRGTEGVFLFIEYNSGNR